ncbi:MAG: YfhO family protein [Clostridia bacterium]|nr:YfhO family protein [Clostridia bacterium]
MKKPFFKVKSISVITSLIVGILVALAVGLMFIRGNLTDLKNAVPYAIKVYIKYSMQGIIFCGLISVFFILLTIGRKQILYAWNKLAYKLSAVVAVRSLLVVTVIVFITIIYCGYIFGGRYFLFSDAGMDTICQFYPMYVHITEEIREGTLSLWNFEWGLGCDMLTRQEWIMDPCAWMAVASGLLFGTETIRHTLLIAQFMKIMACALICFEFLGFYGFSLKSRFTASCLFAFNGWLMLWGQHYYFGMACVYLIILLWLVERLLAAYRKKCSMEWHYLSVGLAVALIFIYSVYFGYMIVVFSSFYTIMRMLYLGYEDEKCILPSLWCELWPVIVTVLLGILCASVMIIPYADIVLNVSTRVKGSFIERIGQYVAALYSKDYYMTLVGRMVSNNTFGILALDQKYYELPQLSFSTLSLIVLPQVIWFGVIRADNNTGMRKHVLRILMALLMVLALTWPFVGAVFNIGLGESLVGGLPVLRFTFVLMPVMAVVYACFIDNCITKRNISIILLISGLVIAYLILDYAFWNYRIYYKWVNIMLIAANVIFTVLVTTLKCQKIMKINKFSNSIMLTIIFCMLAGSCFDGYITNEMRYTYDNTTGSMSDDFHGNRTMAVLDYLDSIDDSFYRVEKVYYDFSSTGDSLIQGYSPFSMYCSTMSEYLKRFYEEFYPIEEYSYPTSDVDFKKYDNAFAVTNTKYIISCFSLEYDYLEQVCLINDVYAYRNIHAGSIGIVYNYVMEYSEFEKLSNNDKNNVLANVMLLPDDEADKVKETMKCNVNEMPDMRPDNSAYFTSINDSNIFGRVNAQQDGMLMLSIPYRRGWNVYVDGIRQKVVNADYGFMAVKITEGEHKVEVKYENIIYIIGLILSIIGIIAIVGWILFVKHKKVV